VATLTDRLDYLLGKKAAGPLEEHFGIRTVNDLLRHYPRKYSDGMTVLGEGEDLEEGEHVTFVDVITKAEAKPMRRQPGKRQRKYLRITLGHRRPEVTATFFNADYMIDNLPEGTRLMLSGEVTYFRKTLQLTHPDFLVLESPLGKKIGTKSLKTIASTSAASDEELLSVFERSSSRYTPPTRKCRRGRSTRACVRSSTFSTRSRIRFRNHLYANIIWFRKTKRCGQSTSRRTLSTETAHATG